MPHYYTRRTHELEQIAKKMFENMYTPVSDLKAVAYWSKEPLPYEKRRSGKKIDIKPGKTWGKLFDCAWFHFTGTVPASAKGRKVALLIDLAGEGCVFNDKGEPIRGLTSVGGGWAHSSWTKRVVQVADKARGGEKIDIWVDAGNNDLFGNIIDKGQFRYSQIAVCNEEMRALCYDAEVLHELMTSLPEDSARRHQIHYAIHRATLALNDFTEEEAAEARKILAPQLAKKGGDTAMRVSAVGHAHIDLAWLWPERETVRKCARTFATVFEMMDRYPEYIFGQSQPQAYEWMEKQYPSIYRQIEKRVKEGRWEPQGCMWVESDTNVPSGEALVRQTLYGKRYFRQKFGRDINHLWLPDVFGYSGSLPQILKKAGVPYFMTQKMSWSLYNKFPHHTFIWKGIDGTSVLSHMPPEDNYNSNASPRPILHAERNNQDKGVCDRMLVLFGVGDGGGGPGAEHLERLAREKNLNGMPRVEQETAERFFQRIERDREHFAEWEGELYLERHRGTYTTQGRSKRYNRKMELALRELEMTSVIAGAAAGTIYPKDQLDEIWKTVLLYQFHDILPGSSITRVYDECLVRYAEMMQETLDLTAQADAAWAAGVDTTGLDKPAVVLNSLSWDRDEWVRVGRRWQRVNVPALGYAAIDTAAKQTLPKLKATENLLENDCLRVRLDAQGRLASVRDKRNKREALAPGEKGNQLVVYEDVGDAWDIPGHYADKVLGEFELVSAKARVDGPRAVIEQKRAYGSSKMTQRIILTAGSPRLDFETEVDWRESERMLRTRFPVSVHSPEVTCEIQFGHLKRATHDNTTWQQAQYEICAQKWIDLSEHGYGVALLNDCKYGHKAKGNVLDIDLLRSPGYPDPVADRGRHEFTYSMLPHAGDHAEADVVRAGYELNVPLRVLETQPGAGALPSSQSFIQIETDEGALDSAVIADTVKRAEDSDDVILRLYEAHGGRAKATVHFGFPVASVELVDLMEENAKSLRVRESYDGASVTVPFGPFEIQTLKVKRK